MFIKIHVKMSDSILFSIDMMLVFNSTKSHSKITNTSGDIGKTIQVPIFDLFYVHSKLAGPSSAGILMDKRILGYSVIKSDLLFKIPHD